MASRKKKRKVALGPLFWVAVILLFIIVFLINKKSINQNIEKFGLTDKFKKQDRELVSKDDSKIEQSSIDKQLQKQGDQNIKIEYSSPDTKPDQTSVTDITRPTKPETTETKPSQTTKATTEDTKPKTEQKTIVEDKKPEKAVETKPVVKVETRDAKLCFLKIDSDGNVSRIEVTRKLPKSNSPLTDSLNSLLEGTNSTEEAKGLRSLIPLGTKLLSVTIKDKIAHINLSDEFQFSAYGIEGYLGQLAQIVYTATVFPTVNSVQFLIDGQRKEFLGAEGVWIGTPLTRDLF